MNNSALDHLAHRFDLRLEERSGLIIMDNDHAAGRGSLFGQKKRVVCLARADSRDELSAQPAGEQDFFCLGPSVS